MEAREPKEQELPQKSHDFASFAATCEKIRSTSSKLAKIDALGKYLRTLENDKDLRIATTFLSGRIFPPGAQETEVNVGYSLLWKALSRIFDVEAGELSKYYLKHGDLGSVAQEVFQSRLTNGLVRPGSTLYDFSEKERSNLSLESVYASFLEIATSVGKNSTGRKFQILERLFSRISSPLELKYLVRILTGEMRIGLVEGLVEESLAKCFGKTLAEVRSANLVSGSIDLVAVLAKHDNLKAARIEILRPTNFMLADTAENAEKLYQKFACMPVMSEYKYDGIRAQIHKKNEEVRIFSRNLADVTRFFPEFKESVLSVNISELILDGEIVAFEGGRPLSFQLLQRRLRKKGVSKNDSPVVYFAFDIIYKEGPMIGVPLKQRSAILSSLDLRPPLIRSEKREVSTSQEISDMFLESKSRGYEGLVVKDPASSYTPGRRGKSWVKLKKELDTLDVVIVAAEYGHGKRAGVISDYTFSVRSGEELKVIGKAYSGLTDAEIEEMTERLKSITVKDYGYRRTVIPQIVIEVAFDAIQRSARHDSGYALRFPRIKRLRPDKSVREIDTLDRVKEIYEAQSFKA